MWAWAATPSDVHVPPAGPGRRTARARGCPASRPSAFCFPGCGSAPVAAEGATAVGGGDERGAVGGVGGGADGEGGDGRGGGVGGAVLGGVGAGPSGAAGANGAGPASGSGSGWGGARGSRGSGTAAVVGGNASVEDGGGGSAPALRASTPVATTAGGRQGC